MAFFFFSSKVMGILQKDNGFTNCLMKNSANLPRGGFFVFWLYYNLELVRNLLCDTF